MTFPAVEIPWMGAEPLLAILLFVVAVAWHFSTGGGLFLALLEHRAVREGNQPLLSFLQDWSRLFLIMSLILGVLLASGTLAVATVAEPAAVHGVLRVFFWSWAVVWILGFLQVVAALRYYSGWGVGRPGHHLATGWIYVGAAWGMLFMLCGVFGFMLSPGDWVKTGRTADGFFNESFSPLLLSHAGASLATAGLFGMVSGAQADLPKLRTTLVRTAALFVAAGFVLLPAAAGWTAAVLPAASRAVVLTVGSTAWVVFWSAIVVSALIVLLMLTGPLARPEGVPASFASLILLLGFAVMFADIRAGETLRQPHVIVGYLYVNGLDARQLPRLDREGFFAPEGTRTPTGGQVFRPEDPARQGGLIFRHQCLSCHTVDGIRGARALVQGWESETLVRQLGRLDELKGPMPPFAGNEAERRALAAWLLAPAPRRPEPPRGPR